MIDLWPTYGISLSFLLLTTLEDATTQQTTLKGHDIESWIKDLCIKNNCSEVILNLLNLELKNSRDYGLKRDEEILFKYLKLIIQEEPSVSDGKRAKRSSGTIRSSSFGQQEMSLVMALTNHWKSARLLLVLEDLKLGLKYWRSLLWTNGKFARKWTNHKFFPVFPWVL